MTRTVDERRRSDLLDRVVEYVLAHGVADLSLRPLARAVKASPRSLLYHFASKDELVVQVVARVRERQRALFERLRRTQGETAVDTCRAAWEIVSAPKAEPAFRLFLEIYGLALKEPRSYGGFLRTAVEDWLAYIERPFLALGHASADARAIATVVLAGYRGFMLDLTATHDRARIGRAVDVWLETLAAVPEPKTMRAARARPTAS